jgi:glycosyltransferase involved in cell wall biosynthesis
MRIGVNCFLLQAHIGGLKQYFVNLFEWLLENDRENTYVFFYFPHNAGELAKLNSDRWREAAILLQTQEEIASHLKPLDVYFCPFSVLWPRPVPLPSVMTLVDIQELFYPQFFTASDRFTRAYHYPASTRAADRVITISDYSKASLVEHHRISSNKVIVAHLCADPLYFEAAAIQTAPEDPIPFSDFVFFPANRWYHKNHDVLLKALAILKDRNKKVDAVFTGFDVDGGYPLMNRAVEYRIRDRVHSAGYVTISQMAYLYLHAGMLVFPSLFEGFGMPPVEAMAAGCPVAVSRSTCLPEICGDAAEYFDPQDPVDVADAICRIQEDKVHREALIANGRIRARAFSAERLAQAHLRAFHEAVECYSPARYRWHRIAYQPFHTWRVGALRRLRRFERRAQSDRTSGIAFPAVGARGNSRSQAGLPGPQGTGSG